MRALQLLNERQLEITNISSPPSPRPDEVTVRIKAVALNHIDVWGWRGMAFAKRKMPLIIGAEASGEVVQVGDNIENLQLGQIVSIYGAQTCGACQACHEGRDNLCTDVKGLRFSS